MSPNPELSVVIPALNEGPNLVQLLPELFRLLDGMGVRSEVLVVTHAADQGTRTVTEAGGARSVIQRERGYGGALLAGFATSRAPFVATMDADISHPPEFLLQLWRSRHDAEVIVASRYVAGGSARMPLLRYVLSRVLNAFFGRTLSLPVRDMSSGFRLYRRDVLDRQCYQARDFDLLQEILVRSFADGWRIKEVPFAYAPRKYGSSHARVVPLGLAYLRTVWPLWKLRNSIRAADYDERAYDSVIPLQRYWQRKRLHHVAELLHEQGPVLDVGCGSSRILQALPAGSVAVDILLRKLRYSRKYSVPLVQASGGQLPFKDGAFPCVLCSEVIEHVPKNIPILEELCRVLAPGGRLVVGTPDYGHWEWVYLEKLYKHLAPGGYADEHITHYRRRELTQIFEQQGYCLETVRYILRGELIMAFRKPG